VSSSAAVIIGISNRLMSSLVSTMISVKLKVAKLSSKVVKKAWLVASNFGNELSSLFRWRVFLREPAPNLKGRRVFLFRVIEEEVKRFFNCFNPFMYDGSPVEGLPNSSATFTAY